MKISIVCVNYNSYDSLKKYLNSLQNALEKCNNIRLEVYVADNSSLKQSISLNYIFSLHIMPFDNLGYFGGAFEIINNQKEIRMSDYIIISNVDLQVTENFFIELQKVKIFNRTAWIAPQIYSNLEERDKNPQRLCRPSKKKICHLIFMFSHPIVQYIYSKTLYKRKKIRKHYLENTEIYCGHGSFIILTRNFFEVYEKIYYPCFLYCEELFLGELIEKAELKTIYKPSLKIIDEEHTSTSQLPSKSYYKFNLESLKYIYNTFYI